MAVLFGSWSRKTVAVVQTEPVVLQNVNARISLVLSHVGIKSFTALSCPKLSVERERHLERCV